MAERDMVGHDQSEYVLLQHTIAEDLKVPLTRILAHTQTSSNADLLSWEYLRITADSAIRLIDSYLVSTQIYNNQQQLHLEPVSIPAVMKDVSEQMNRFAKQQGKHLELVVSRQPGLVMANGRALHAALTTLTYSLLQATNSQPSRITLRTEHKNGKVLCGIYETGNLLTNEMLRTIRLLRGRASRLSSQLPYGTSSGIAIADCVFESMGVSLRVGQGKYGRGLVAQFAPSTQMSLW